MTAGSGEHIGILAALLAPWRALTAPRFYGFDNVPRDRPFLLVGNHTLMGLLDAPLLFLELAERFGIDFRSLGAHVHFRVPGWRELLAWYGAVDGTPENCRALMRAGKTILVFPGGGREVFKRKREKYRLMWGDRIGFARLAIEHGYPILPFGTVGAEECYEILIDAGDLLATPLAPVIRWLFSRAEELPPLVRGLGPTLLPRPERMYFSFAPAVETSRFATARDRDTAAFAVRELVRTAIEAEIAFLLEERQRDPGRSLLARLVGVATQYEPSSNGRRS